MSLKKFALPHVPPELQRPFIGFIALAVLTFFLALSSNGAQINFSELWDNRANVVSMAGDFFPPDISNWQLYLEEMLVTVQIALWGTFLAVLMAIPFGLMAAKNIGPTWLVFIVRRLMDACRAINDLVFALIFVAAVGLGSFAGVLALFIHTTGVLTKLFSEAVESINPKPVEGIRATGASLLAEIRFGVLPQVFTLWSSYTLYRFESNVRAATVLGIVGAGGIGQSLYETVRSFDYQEACTILIIIVICVSIIDMISARLRAFSL